MTKSATATEASGHGHLALLEARHVDALNDNVRALTAQIALGNQLATKQLAATRELIQALTPSSLNGNVEHSERRKAKR